MRKRVCDITGEFHVCLYHCLFVPLPLSLSPCYGCAFFWADKLNSLSLLVANSKEGRTLLPLSLFICDIVILLLLFLSFIFVIIITITFIDRSIYVTLKWPLNDQHKKSLLKNLIKFVTFSGISVKFLNFFSFTFYSNEISLSSHFHK